MKAAEMLDEEGISIEVVDLRVLRPLDDETIFNSVRKTHRALIVEEGWRSGSLSAEISSRIMENLFYELDLPVERLCSVEVPMPYSQPHGRSRPAPTREDRRYSEKDGAVMSEFHMPSLGADMEAGTLVEWKIKPGDTVKKGDIIAVVETAKGVVEIEIFDVGIVDEIYLRTGRRKCRLGQVLAMVLSPQEMAAKASCPAAKAAEPASCPGQLRLQPRLCPLRQRSSQLQLPAPAASGERARVSPLARKIAAELNVDLSTVEGTGPGGAIQRADIERAAKQAKAAPAAPAPAPAARTRDPTSPQPPAAAPAPAQAPAPRPGGQEANRLPNRHASGDRRGDGALQPRYPALLPGDAHRHDQRPALAGRRKPQTHRQRPPAAGSRSDQSSRHGAHRSARAERLLEGRPAVISEEIHIGFAIALRQGGLITPAIHNADMKGWDELREALNDLIMRTRAGRLRSSELTDGTITAHQPGRPWRGKGLWRDLPAAGSPGWYGQGHRPALGRERDDRHPSGDV